MVVRIYPENPNPRALSQVVDALKNDGVIIYPTDSVYAFGCSLASPRAIDRMRATTGKHTTEFSLICADLSSISTYAKVDTPTFKLLKRHLPGPFTFVLPASGKLSERYLERRKEVGIRITDNAITQAIVELLGCPLVTTSVSKPTLESEYTTDPSLLEEMYGDQVALLVDGGYGLTTPTTIVDYTQTVPVVVRQGRGELIE